MSRRLASAALLGLGCLIASAQTSPPPANSSAPAADWQDWLATQTESLLRNTIAQLDEDQAIAALDALLKQLETANPKDRAALHAAAAGLVPWLEQTPETEPYAIWLRTRLDYFDAPPLTPAKPPPTPAPGQPLPRTPTVWDRKLADRPPPPQAAAYLPRLKRAFVEQGVPQQLVWLAEVESSFDARAKSPAGAAGLFQITKPTAKSLGLSTWWPDERMHPEKSARAAAGYLRHLFKRFADWPLALAAYNAGETRVATLLEETSMKSFDAIAGRLPKETRMYVPKIEAVLRKRESVELAQLPPPTP